MFIKKCILECFSNNNVFMVCEWIHIFSFNMKLLLFLVDKIHLNFLNLKLNCLLIVNNCNYNNKMTIRQVLLYNII